MYQYQSQSQLASSDSSTQSQSAGGSNQQQQQRLNTQSVFPSNIILQKGSTGSMVRLLQEILQGMGFEITADGSYGPRTERVVRNYQRLNNLDIDGVAGQATLMCLAPQSSSQTTAGSDSSGTTAPPTQTTTDIAPSESPTPPTNNLTTVEHQVFPNESLWAIASQYYGDGSRWREIANANGLSSASVLRVGQKIQVPNVRSTEATVSPEVATPAPTSSTAVEETPSTNNTSSAEHRVFPGESLWVIASQYYGDGSRWREIANANGLSSASVLRVGQVLQIPNATTQSSAPVVSAPAPQAETTNAGSGTAETEQAETVQAPPVSEGGMGAPDPIPLAGLNGLRRQMAIIYNEKGAYLKRKADALGISVAAAAAVLHVESGGRGFGGDGRMIIRFENHIFWDQWGRANAQLFDQHFQFASSQQWKGHKFRPNTNAPWESFHGNQSKEWEVLEFARNLSDTGALKSISMGAAQIMGFNHRGIGYDDVQSMFDAMCNGLPAQLDGMFSFIENNSRCMRGLRNNDYVLFASAYNGSGQAATYGGMISSAASSFQTVANGRSMI